MKIGPTDYARLYAPGRLRKAAAPAPADADAHVVVSAAARLLSGGSAEVVSAERLAALRVQIEKGTYEIDNQRLAKALIEEELRWHN